MENGYSYFENKDCKYYPCHKKEGENFNCLFCFCPLYTLGEECGGSFTYTADGVKDCSGCVIPHTAEGYDYIITKCPLVKEKSHED